MNGATQADGADTRPQEVRKRRSRLKPDVPRERLTVVVRVTRSRSNLVPEFSIEVLPVKRYEFERARPAIV